MLVERVALFVTWLLRKFVEEEQRCTQDQSRFTLSWRKLSVVTDQHDSAPDVNYCTSRPGGSFTSHSLEGAMRNKCHHRWQRPVTHTSHRPLQSRTTPRVTSPAGIHRMDTWMKTTTWKVTKCEGKVSTNVNRLFHDITDLHDFCSVRIGLWFFDSKALCLV